MTNVLQHVVFFRWKEDVTEVERVGLHAAAQAMAREASGIRTFASGPNLAGSTWDYVLSASFLTLDDFQLYSADPAHLAFVESWPGRMLQVVEIAQFWAEYLER